MVVKNRSSAVPHTPDKRHHRAYPYVLFGQGPVKPPPEPFQNPRENPRGRPVRLHSQAKCAVKMGVCASHPGIMSLPPTSSKRAFGYFLRSSSHGPTSVINSRILQPRRLLSHEQAIRTTLRPRSLQSSSAASCFTSHIPSGSTAFILRWRSLQLADWMPLRHSIRTVSIGPAWGSTGGTPLPARPREPAAPLRNRAEHRLLSNPPGIARSRRNWIASPMGRRHGIAALSLNPQHPGNLRSQANILKLAKPLVPAVPFYGGHRQIISFTVAPWTLTTVDPNISSCTNCLLAPSPERILRNADLLKRPTGKR